MVRKNLLVFQSGGPTAVINASLAGVIGEARRSGTVDRVIGARYGVEGILEGQLLDLTGLGVARIARLRRTPSAALGTSRHRPTDAEIDEILARLIERNVVTIVGIGGNDTAETLLRLGEAASDAGKQIRVVAVPKTIDNDLPEMDHCPGYGSIARFVALAVRDSTLDTRSMARVHPVKIVEVMGRNAGWVTAAGSLLFSADEPRPLLCLPERPVADADNLAERVRKRLDREGYAVVVAPETMRWAGGRAVGGDEPTWVDAFGHPYFPSAGSALARLLGQRLNVKTRFDKPGTIARMAMHAVSEVDLAEAETAGREATARGLAGESGVMVTIQRREGELYAVEYGAVPLERIANSERRLPCEMIADDGMDVSPAFYRYALPLIGDEVQPYETLSGLQPG